MGFGQRGSGVKTMFHVSQCTRVRSFVSNESYVLPGALLWKPLLGCPSRPRAAALSLRAWARVRISRFLLLPLTTSILSLKEFSMAVLLCTVAQTSDANSRGIPGCLVPQDTNP